MTKSSFLIEPGAAIAPEENRSAWRAQLAELAISKIMSAKTAGQDFIRRLSLTIQYGTLALHNSTHNK